MDRDAEQWQNRHLFRIDLAGSQVHLNSVGARPSWGPGWLKPDSNKVGIVITENGTLDIDAQQPLKNGEPNRIKGKTTIKKESFITHEPFTRPAGGRDKDDIEVPWARTMTDTLNI
jgi:hypothetical protein